MTDQNRTPIAAAIGIIGAQIDVLEEDPRSMTEAEFKSLLGEASRLFVLERLLALRFEVEHAAPSPDEPSRPFGDDIFKGFGGFR